MSMAEQDLEGKPPAQPKTPERDTLRREIDRIARQLEGLIKSLKKIKETT